jgi:hypothetical protein
MNAIRVLDQLKLATFYDSTRELIYHWWNNFNDNNQYDVPCE